MTKHRKIEILEKYVNGKASKAEETYIENEFSKGGLNFLLRKYLKEDWNNLEPKGSLDLDYILGHIHDEINKKEPTGKLPFLNRAYRVYVQMAAVLLIPLLLSVAYYIIGTSNGHSVFKENRATSKIVAPYGSRIAFNLPDGSKGFLNSGSSMIYSIPFSDSRNVTLEGEAWFDVKKDSRHPFEVRSGPAVIRVLGTSFNVSAYEGEGQIEVFLESGIVEFIAGQQSKPVRLEPSEHLIFKNRTINIDKTEAEKFKGWTEGKLVFRGDNMKEVAGRIGRWYNVDIEIEDKELEDYVFRATFIDNSLTEVLQFLSLASPIDYRITSRKQLSEDKRDKEKVTLTKRKISTN